MDRAELLKQAKPILFNTEMVIAILEGRKTVTRRVINRDTSNQFDCEADGTPIAYIDQATGDSYKPWEVCRFKKGDYLYVRETWCDDRQFTHDDTPGQYIFKADFPIEGWSDAKEFRWKPSIHMPKEAARIFLKVTRVRVERLQDITEEQALAEGIRGYSKDGKLYKYAVTDDWWIKFHEKHKKSFVGSWWQDMPRTAKEAFSYLWNSTIKKADLNKYGWGSNPWVWTIEFERVEV